MDNFAKFGPRTAPPCRAKMAPIVCQSTVNSAAFVKQATLERFAIKNSKNAR
jgi:hypothetical protein